MCDIMRHVMLCDVIFTHHFRQEFGGQIMNGFAQDTHGG